MKQRTFKDAEEGDLFICFKEEISLHYVIPVIRKLPELTDNAGKRYNSIFFTEGRLTWVNPDKPIVLVE